MTAKQPLVLFHALGMSPRVWDEVTPRLDSRLDVVALTTLGHRGGLEASRRPVTVGDFVDAAERELDERGLDRPHLAGNSLGGWMAIELARRGRARSVCALSPAGSWTAGTNEQTHGVRKLRMAVRGARMSRVLPMSLMCRSAAMRRFILRDAATHGDRLTAAQVMGVTADLLGCPIMEDVLTTREQMAPLDPLPCPVTLAWAGRDLILPLEVNGAVARQRLPQARFAVIDGVGHVAMIDDPAAVAQVILETTGAALTGSASAP